MFLTFGFPLDRDTRSRGVRDLGVSGGRCVDRIREWFVFRGGGTSKWATNTNTNHEVIFFLFSCRACEEKAWTVVFVYFSKREREGREGLVMSMCVWVEQTIIRMPSHPIPQKKQDPNPRFQPASRIMLKFSEGPEQRGHASWRCSCSIPPLQSFFFLFESKIKSWVPGFVSSQRAPRREAAASSAFSVSCLCRIVVVFIHPKVISNSIVTFPGRADGGMTQSRILAATWLPPRQHNIMQISPMEFPCDKRRQDGRPTGGRGRRSGQPRSGRIESAKSTSIAQMEERLGGGGISRTFFFRHLMRVGGPGLRRYHTDS